MATQNAANELGRLIDKLHKERSQLVEEIERIDETFRQFGIDAGDAPAKPGRRSTKKKTRGRPKSTASKKTKSKKVSKRRGRRRRQTFSKTGEESVLEFVTKAGKPTTAEVNEHWIQEGRGGKADNTLSKLVSQKKIKRNNIKGERGSRYEAA